jgi:hypothetical protein
MKLRFMILVAEMTLGANPTTSFATGPHLAIGDGNQSCEAWTQERARETQLVLFWKEWVLGFVSGANVYDGNPELFPGQRPDAAAIYAWIDNYCRAYPGEKLLDAVIALVGELLDRARQTNPQ